MIKMTEQDGKSLDIVNDNLEALKASFPEAFTEDGVDFEVFCQLLGDSVNESEEKYGLTWHGKKKARQIALMPSLGTLRPSPEESVDWDTTQNLFIEGDNLEVLKLLQKSYANKVKMIYIDPPYNTGKEFIYPDKFQDNLDTYLKYTGQKDDEGFKLSSNTESSGRYHTNWLNMMYPRLKLARNLLRDDGILLISIDDNEIINLRKLCDEIFGEENFVCSITVVSNPRGRQSDTHVASVHDYLVCYSKSSADCLIGGAPLTKVQKSDFKYSDDDGLYRLLGLRQRGSASRREDRPDMFFPIYVHKSSGKISLSAGNENEWEAVFPRKSDRSDSRWMWGKEKVEKDMHLLVARLIERRGEYDIFVKDHLRRNGTERTRKYKTCWNDKCLNNQAGTQEVKKLLRSGAMSYPKPTGLLLDACNLGCPEDGIILDFFAGSCTTAHAVLDLNKEDGSKRKFIMVQLPEPCDEKSEAFKAGYKNISEIGKERIRRVIKNLRLQIDDLGLKEANKQPTLLEDDNQQYRIKNLKSLDLGFKVFKLDSSNIRAWNPDRNDLEQTLLDHMEHLVEGRSEEDVLYELLLKRGVGLTVPIEEKTITGKTVYSIGYGVLFACLDTAISRKEVEDLAQGIIGWHKELEPDGDTQVVFRDSAFANDIAKTNMTAILEQHGIAHVRSL